MPAPTALLLNHVEVTGTGPHVELTNDLTSGSLIAQLGALDPDTDETFTYELIDDAGGLFFLSGNLLRRSEGGVLDPDAVSYTVTVRVTDSTGLTFTTNIVLGSTAVTITVVADGTSGNDTLDFQNSVSDYIIANGGDDAITTDGSDIIVFSGSRADYDIVYTSGSGGGGYGGYGGYGSGAPDSITITDLRPGSPNGTDIIIGTTGFLFDEGRYNVDTGGEVTPTEVLGLDGRQLGINAVVLENGPIGQVLGTLTATGFDPGLGVTILSWEVLSAPNEPSFNQLDDTGSNFLTIDAQGRLVTTAPLNWEQYQSHSVRVTFLDPNGVQHTESLFVQVTDGPEAPTAIALRTVDDDSLPASISEHRNRLGDVEVGQIVVFDADGSTNGYSFELTPEFVDDFYIVGNRLFLRQGALIDEETDPIVQIDIIVRDLDLHPDAAPILTGSLAVEFARLYATAGETSLSGTAGVDVIFRTPGVTTVNAGDGNDFIIANQPNSVLRWASPDLSSGDLVAGATLAIGAITAHIDADIYGTAPTAFSTVSDVYSLRIEPFENGSIYYTTGDSEFAGEAGLTSNLSIVFTDASGDAEVTGVTFRILDIDAGEWQDIVSINAFDGAGNAVAVTITGNGDDDLVGNTVTGSELNDMLTSATGSVLVTIAGPVHRLEIDYSNGRLLSQALGVTDIHFNAPNAGPLTGATLSGEGGDDSIFATDHSDSLLGGDGNDILAALSGDDMLDGGAGDDQLAGQDGADIIQGGAGNDRLNGGEGADQMSGGAGDDIYNFATLGDTIVELAGEGVDLVRTTLGSYTLQENVENLDLLDGAASTGIGNALANRILSYGGDDLLDGRNGDDILSSGVGADTLLGGNGNDQLFGQFGDDFLNGGANDDVLLGGLGRDRMTGGSGQDMLDGDIGNDVLHGGLGDDVVNGGEGRDQLFGDAGADRFVFAFGDFGINATNGDVIRDFSQAQGDIIDLSALDAVAGGNDDAFTFIGGAAFSGTAGELRFESNGGDTLVLGDTNGDGAADFGIVLTGVHALDELDFWL